MLACRQPGWSYSAVAARVNSQQLRGTADKRQVEGARLALQHNLGLGGACVVTLYERV